MASDIVMERGIILNGHRIITAKETHEIVLKASTFHTLSIPLYDFAILLYYSHV